MISSMKHKWGNFTQFLTGTPQNKTSTKSYGRPATLGTGAINNRTPKEINENNILQYLKIESMYIEDVIKLIDDGKTVYVGEDPSLIPSATTPTMSPENKIKKIKKDRLRSKESNQMYEVYIVISLDIESMKQKVIYKQGKPITETNRICWKWGSEKEFFDILNVLVDQLTGQTLESYSKNRMGQSKPIDALKKLWREYRDDTEVVPNNTTQLRTLKEKVEQINVSGSTIKLKNKFGPNTPTEYLNSDYIIAFILKAYDPSINKKYRKTFHLFQGLENNLNFNALSYNKIKHNFKTFLKENIDYLEGDKNKVIQNKNIFTKNIFKQNTISLKNSNLKEKYTGFLKKLKRKERLIVETVRQLNNNKYIKYKIGSNELYINKINVQQFIDYLTNLKKDKYIQIPINLTNKPINETNIVLTV
jgi:hypothetical protein